MILVGHIAAAWVLLFQYGLYSQVYKVRIEFSLTFSAEKGHIAVRNQKVETCFWSQTAMVLVPAPLPGGYVTFGQMYQYF
jgi:hypothetical protein